MFPLWQHITLPTSVQPHTHPPFLIYSASQSIHFHSSSCFVLDLMQMQLKLLLLCQMVYIQVWVLKEQVTVLWKKTIFGMCLRSLIWSLVKFWLKPRTNGCSPLGSSACLASWRRAAANPEFADWATAFPLVSGLRGLTVAVLRVAVEIIPKDGDLVDSWFIPGKERW